MAQRKKRELTKQEKILQSWGIDLIGSITKAVDAQDNSRPDDGYFHSSSLARCTRTEVFNKLYGKPNNKKDAFGPAAKMSMALGHSIHDLLQGAIHQISGFGADRKVDPQWRFVRFEDEVRLVSDEDILAGTCDGILSFINPAGELEHIIIEIKSTKSTLFDSKFAHHPKADHVLQVQSYMYMASKQFPELKIEKAIILYFNKDNNAMAAHPIEYDRPYVKKLLDRQAYAKQCLEREVIPSKYLSCKDMNNLDKKCSNYLRCKKYNAGETFI